MIHVSNIKYHDLNFKYKKEYRTPNYLSFQDICFIKTFI